jgi:predicted nucleotidyltransferase component of viral defense system
VPEALSRSRRRIVADVMSVVAADGFVITGGVALIVAGVSSRSTHALDAFSATCDDVAQVADRLIERLRASGYLVEAHRSDAAFARMTVSTGKYRRTVLIVELGRDHQLFAPVASTLGPTLSIRELAANKVLAAFGRREPRDLVDLASLADAISLRQAVVDARTKDPGFSRDAFVEMVNRTLLVRDDLWPQGSDPDAVRDFARRVLLDPDLFG